jgi:hypothetical protein
MLSRRALALALVALPVTIGAFAAEKASYSSNGRQADPR